jgi:hypothetical protein
MTELESILVLDEKQVEFARLFPSPGVAVSLNLAKFRHKGQQVAADVVKNGFLFWGFSYNFVIAGFSGRVIELARLDAVPLQELAEHPVVELFFENHGLVKSCFLLWLSQIFQTILIF